MNTFVALLRAVNVGGTGKLSMVELKAMCEAQGFQRVKTFIASGNVVFCTDKSESVVKTLLEAALHQYAGKPVGVFVRNQEDLQKILKANPFKNKEPNKTAVIFNDQLPGDDLGDVAGRDKEEIKAFEREIFVYYPEGMGKTKLRISAARSGTTRNINTVTKLAEMAYEMAKNAGRDL